MRWLLANPLKTLPPLGLVAVGVLVGAAGVPVLKKTARGLAVLAVKGVTTVSNMVKEAGDHVSNTKVPSYEPHVSANFEEVNKPETPAGYQEDNQKTAPGETDL